MLTILNRRDFLKVAGMTGVGLALGPRLLLRNALGAERSGGRRPILVHIFQRGAMDGLSAVVPYAEPHYAKFRRLTRIAAPKKGDPASAIDLDGRFGLHPALAGFAAEFRAKRLAIVDAVGSPNPTRSHFDAQDYMETGTPQTKHTRDGWMNRYVEENLTKKDHFQAVSITSTLPRSLKGDAPALAISNFRSFTLGGGGFIDGTLAAMYDHGKSDSVHDSGREAFEAIRVLKKANPTRFKPANGAKYPRGRFGSQMLMIAQLIKAGVGLEIAFADIGGWDTHFDQGGSTGRLARQLTELGDSLHAFSLDLGEKMNDVVVVTLTEFGRTARENGTGGTDHGHASVSFVLGGKVRGGAVKGHWPGLAPKQLYQNRDLAVTTDFRDVLGEILEKHMHAKGMSRILPGYSPNAVGLL